jgi:hypothetical protein
MIDTWFVFQLTHVFTIIMIKNKAFHKKKYVLDKIKN